MRKIKIDDLKDRKPFEVPEGYFENLTEQIMESLPERKNPVEEIPQVSLWTKMKPLVYLAAMLIGAAFIVRVLVDTKPVESEYATQINIDEVSDEFLDETIEAAFLDDYSMHLYLTSNSE